MLINIPEGEFSYENVLRKTHGLLDINIKVSVRDRECLSMVYTPGVAIACLDIQKDPIRAYEFTNKGNAIIVLTDSSGLAPGKLPNELWNSNAAMPFLEAFSAYYKSIANIDAYPIILDLNLIPDAATLLETINAIAPAYAGVELFMVDNERMEKFKQMIEQSGQPLTYAYIDSSARRMVDCVLWPKGSDITANALYAAVWRAALDTHTKADLSVVLDAVLEDIKTNKIDLTKKASFYKHFEMILGRATEYILENNLADRTLDKFNWLGEPLSKEFVLNKYKSFRIFGTKGWVEPMPDDYYMHQHTNTENANLLHSKNRGVLETRVKLRTPSVKELNAYFIWNNLDHISKLIINNPDEVYNLTCKKNYGAIITNGTAILGLGNIGALSGLPVLEGKSVVFKHLGGNNIIPIAIQELNPDKFVSIVQRIAPSFCIINLEDIRGPECFEIEPKLIESLDIPVFHDDQHGSAIVILAALINALKLRGNKPDEVKIVLNGAGAAGIAGCRLLMSYGFKNFIVCDKEGAIYRGRTKHMNPFKEEIANKTNPDNLQGSLGDVIKGADVFIGLSGPNILKKGHVKSMAPKPIIFSLANPIPEILPKDSHEAGAFIVATGRSDYPNQINDSVAFPGLFRGTVDTRAKKITQEMKFAAAETIAGLVSEHDLRVDHIIPSNLNISNAINVATAVAKTVKMGDPKEMGEFAKKVSIDKLRENIHSYFIDGKLGDVEK